MAIKIDSGSNAIVRELLISVVINGLIPYLIYSFLNNRMGSIAALLIAAVPPTLASIISLVSRKHLDVLGVIILAGLTLSIIAALVGGSERILLARESLVTGLIGLGFVASLFFPRPVQFYLARYFATGNTPTKVAQWNSLWKKSATFRSGMRLMTASWGFGLMLEAVLRIGLALTIPISIFLLISPLIQYGFYFGLIGWTVWYSKGMQHKF
jgi:hypothetical protein